MELKAMVGITRSGTFRLVAGSAAALALLAQGARGQSSAGGVVTAKVTVTQDSGGRINRMIIVRQLGPRIDSLVKRLNALPVGSYEAFVVDSALQAALREWPIEFVRTNEKMQVELNAARGVVRYTQTDAVPQGWLGFTTGAVNRTWFSSAGNFVQYFEYPTVVAIDANSPASRAGVKPGDSVLAYDGVDVRREPINLTSLLTPGREVAVRLRRDGEARDVLIAVEKAPAAVMEERKTAVAAMAAATKAELVDRRVVEGVAATRKPTTATRAPVVAGVYTARVPYALQPSQSGVLGAAMADVDESLSKSLRGMDGRRGVLVTVVPAGSLADRTGLHTGDVILRVEGGEIASVPELRVRLHAAEVSGAARIRLQVLRAGKTREITFVPR